AAHSGRSEPERATPRAPRVSRGRPRASALTFAETRGSSAGSLLLLLLRFGDLPTQLGALIRTLDGFGLRLAVLRDLALDVLAGRGLDSNGRTEERRERGRHRERNPETASELHVTSLLPGRRSSDGMRRERTRASGESGGPAPRRRRTRRLGQDGASWP